MSKFAAAARLVLACQAQTSGQAWIAFHRCVEAYSRLSGEPFSAIFARIGGAHGFDRDATVEVARLQAATRALAREREELLRERALLVAARRLEKRAGQRVDCAPALRSLEARHRVATRRQPAVGYWGWRALREGQLGPRLGVPGGPPTFGGSGRRLYVDLRGHPLPDGLAEALSAALPGGQAHRLALLIQPAQLGAWRTRAEGSAGAATLRGLGRLSWGRSAVLLVTPHPLTPAQELDLGGLERALRALGWGLHLVTGRVPAG